MSSAKFRARSLPEAILTLPLRQMRAVCDFPSVDGDADRSRRQTSRMTKSVRSPEAGGAPRLMALLVAPLVLSTTLGQPLTSAFMGGIASSFAVPLAMKMPLE